MPAANPAAKPVAATKPSTAKPAPKPPAPKGPLTQIVSFDHDREIQLARFSPCGRFVLIAGCDGIIHRITVQGEQRTQITGHDGWVMQLAFHPDKKRLFSIDSWGRISAWNYADEKPAALWTKPDTHQGWTKGLAISPDGALLASCGSDKIIRLWSTADGALKAELPGHQSQIFCVQFHTTEPASLISGDLKGIIKHWDVAAGKLVRELDAQFLYQLRNEIVDLGGVRFFAFDAAGKTLVAGGAETLTSGAVTAKPTVLLFDWASGKKTHQLQRADAKPEDGFALDAAFDPRGFLMVVTSGVRGQGELWCWKPGEAAPFYLNKELPHCRSIHQLGNRLAIAQVGRGGGNGRQLTKTGEYPSNPCMVRIFESTIELPKA